MSEFIEAKARYHYEKGERDEAWDGGFRTPPKNVEILMDYIEADRGKG